MAVRLISQTAMTIGARKRSGFFDCATAAPISSAATTMTSGLSIMSRR